MGCCVIIKSYILKNVAGRKITSQHITRRTETETVGCRIRFQCGESKHSAYMHRRTRENVDSDYLGVAYPGDFLLYTTHVF